MKVSVIQRWLIIGVAEVLLSLLLLVIAPTFLNSNKPLIGFLIWVFVLAMLGGSGLYVVLKVADASKARNILITEFPEYAHLGILYFVGIPSQLVSQRLAWFEAVKDDPDFQSLNISPLDLFQQPQHKLID